MPVPGATISRARPTGNAPTFLANHPTNQRFIDFAAIRKVARRWHSVRRVRIRIRGSTNCAISISDHIAMSKEIWATPDWHVEQPRKSQGLAVVLSKILEDEPLEKI